MSQRIDQTRSGSNSTGSTAECYEYLEARRMCTPEQTGISFKN